MSIGLTSAFGTRVIPGNTEIAWPACGPDEARCDYFLWGICDQEIRRVKPRNFGKLQAVVSDFVESPDEDVARRAVRMSGPGPRCASNWRQSQLKKYKRGTIEELKDLDLLHLGTRR